MSSSFIKSTWQQRYHALFGQLFLFIFKCFLILFVIFCMKHETSSLTGQPILHRSLVCNGVGREGNRQTNCGFSFNEVSTSLTDKGERIACRDNYLKLKEIQLFIQWLKMPASVVHTINRVELTLVIKKGRIYRISGLKSKSARSGYLTNESCGNMNADDSWGLGKHAIYLVNHGTATTKLNPSTTTKSIKEAKAQN
ncbi:hypothetical protein EGR_09170 [Echinococcus granulosus]|uniref:Uncharacterized protein n=1 Tax=Echinococcus granulosus TaxID=6210 RepID=W6U6K7_ECHGR|nr:hypothetical protein EGR_09170 [Echinococcus granulosus]EUB55966.1 hypothetical protein EGR_09170 [Echinococcus granulosus]